nr:immunoglobulin light chain junction region [Macaca mulatta]
DFYCQVWHSASDQYIF